MAEGLLQRLAEGLLTLAARGQAVVQRRAGDHAGQRDHAEHHDSEGDGGELPAKTADHAAGDGRKQELTEGARRRAKAEGDGAHVLGHQLHQGADDHVERAARQAQPHDDASRDGETGGRGGISHQDEARPVEQAAAGQHPRGAILISQRPGEGLSGAPKKILNRHGVGEDVAAPAPFFEDRQLKHANGRARPESQHADEAAHHDDDLGRQLASELHGLFRGILNRHGASPPGGRAGILEIIISMLVAARQPHIFG